MNENFPKLNSANFTITDDFKKALARPDYRIILFKVVANSVGNAVSRETFAYCDYIDEDIIVADLPYRDFGDIQADTLEFKYLAIENSEYRSFLNSVSSIADVMSYPGWELAFTKVKTEETEGNLILEPTGYNYIFFDFSNYDLNCSIQLLNTFDKSDREFIHSHYHSKNSGHTDILSTDGYLGYYDDIEYSKFDSLETNTLRDEIKIDSDKFSDGTKPSELKLNHKSNFVRMFRPEEYYHMGDFTVKLLGKPLQETKYKYASEDVNNADKLSREDLKVLGVTNPTSEVTDERDLQYVDMFDYNKYLQPVFRMWDKNANPTKISSSNPYLYTIKKFAVDKSFMTFFRCMSSDGYFEVTLTYKGTSGNFNEDNLHANIRYVANNNIGSNLSLSSNLINTSYKIVDNKFQVYFSVTSKSLTLLEAGIRNDVADKDSMTLIDEKITGIPSGINNLPVSSKSILNQNKVNLEIAGVTEDLSHSDRNLWNGNLIPATYNGVTLTLTSLGGTVSQNQYAKFVFTDYNKYSKDNNPWDATIETSVTLLGGLNDGSSDQNVALGVPYLSVTKGLQAKGTTVLEDAELESLYVSDAAEFTPKVVFKSALNHKSSKGNWDFIDFVEADDNYGDALLLKGCCGSLAIGSGEAVKNFTTLNSSLGDTTNHNDFTITAGSENLVIASDKNIYLLTNCKEGNHSYGFVFGSNGDFSLYNSNVYMYGNKKFTIYGDILARTEGQTTGKRKISVQNENGGVSLFTYVERGLYDDTKGRFLLGYRTSDDITFLAGGNVQVMNNFYVSKAATITGNLIVNGITSLKNTSIVGKLDVSGKVKALNHPDELTAVGSTGGDVYYEWGKKSKWSVGQVKHIFNDKRGAITIQCFVTENTSGSDASLDRFTLQRGAYFDAMCLAFKNAGNNLGEYGVFAILGRYNGL